MGTGEWAPKYWFPSDVDRSTHAEPGKLVAWNFQPWRLISATAMEDHGGDERWCRDFLLVLRPVDADPTVTAHKGDVHLRGRKWDLRVLQEHYGLCVHCHELMPCRAREAEKAAEYEAERMRRYETAGVCPSCQEPVTNRQEHETFPNVIAPLGPPVTFHTGRKKCYGELKWYRKKVAQPESQLWLGEGPATC